MILRLAEFIFYKRKIARTVFFVIRAIIEKFKADCVSERASTESRLQSRPLFTVNYYRVKISAFIAS